MNKEVRQYLAITAVVAVSLAAGLITGRWEAYVVAYIVGGGRIAISTWEELKELRLSIDFLMLAAALGAATVGRPAEGVVLIFLFSLSNSLERFAMGKTRDAITKLLDLRPQQAMLVDANGKELGLIAVELLEPGHLVFVKPGERIPADGVVSSGESEVDQAAITGESRLVAKQPGETVFAGTINHNGTLVINVTVRSDQTMLAKIVTLVEEAREQRAPAQHFVDRFAHPYTLSVVVITALVAIVPPVFFHVEWHHAFYRAMTLLVVASPCALVLSTPSAILSAIANGARHGILFKGGAYLDLAGTIDTVAFDKTGTLTQGRPRLQEILSASDCSADQVLEYAAAVEMHSEHHLARALVDAAQERNITLPAITDFVAVPGIGVSGCIGSKSIWAGNARMAEKNGIALDALVQGWTASQTALGRSMVYVGSGPCVLGAISLGDALRHNASSTIRHLKYEGIRSISLLTGDHPEAARAMALELGVDEVKAGLLPHEKVDAIHELVRSSRGVAMVGDGVNDAPAMAAATLGIAMGAAGTDVAIETADVVLMSDDVEKVDYVVHLGKRARTVVRQNVFFSVGWMLFLVVMSLTVGLQLPIAVVAHEGSTLLVIGNGLRMLRGEPHPPNVPGV